MLFLKAFPYVTMHHVYKCLKYKNTPTETLNAWLCIYTYKVYK